MITYVRFPDRLRVAEQLREVFPSFPFMHRAGDIVEAKISEKRPRRFSAADLSALLIDCLKDAEEAQQRIREDDDPEYPAPTPLDRSLYASIVLQNAVHEALTARTYRNEFAQHVTRCVELLC